MPAGPHRHRLAIDQATETRNSIGEVTLSWPGPTIATVWAEKLEPGGTEQMAAAQLYGTRAVVFRLREYRSGIRTKMRARDLVEGRVYDIESVEDPAGRRRELVLTCVERGV